MRCPAPVPGATPAPPELVISASVSEPLLLLLGVVGTSDFGPEAEWSPSESNSRRASSGVVHVFRTV